MTLNWYLGDFLTGKITRSTPLPVTDNMSVDEDIHGEDEASIEIPMKDLTQYERNNWRDTFHELLKFCVLDNPDVPWDQPGAVLAANLINKITPSLNPWTLKLQLVGMNEYAKARIIGETYGEVVTDPTRAIYFKADTWEGILAEGGWRMFNNDYLSEIGPKVPTTLGTVGTYSGTTREKDVLITDVMTYAAFFEEVSRYDSGVGIEYRWVPRYTSAARDTVVWDFVTGTEAAPHINVETVVDLVLDENEENISSWDLTIDSNELYSALSIQSRAGDEETKSGSDFKAVALPAESFPLLVERSFRPGVELTQAERDAQLASRLDFAGKSKYTAGFTVELTDANPVLWKSRVGATLNVQGIENTLSADHDAELRCVGVSYNPAKKTVSIDVMQKQPIYPRLPWKDLDGLIGEPEGKLGGGEKYTYHVQNTSATTLIFSTTDPRVRWAQFTNDQGNIDMSVVFSSGRGTYNSPVPLGSGKVHVTFYGESDTWLGEGSWDLLEFGGAMPELPSTDWGVDGDEWSNSGLWGGEGRMPDENQIDYKNPIFVDARAEEYTFENFDGLYPIEVSTTFQDQGNRIYGLDRASEARATKIEDGVFTHYNGGINTGTGAWLGDRQGLYIKKTYMGSDGKLGPIETVGVVTPEELDACFAEYEQNDYFGNSYYKSGFLFSNWVVFNRYYLCVAHIVLSTDHPDNSNGLWYRNAKLSVLSKSIDGSNGKLTGDWKTESNLPGVNGAAFFPFTDGIVRYGNVCVFTRNRGINDVRLKNLSNGDIWQMELAWRTENGLSMPNEGGISNYKHSSAIGIVNTITDYDRYDFPYGYHFLVQDTNSNNRGNHLQFYKNFEALDSKYVDFKGAERISGWEGVAPKHSKPVLGNIFAADGKIYESGMIASVGSSQVMESPDWKKPEVWDNPGVAPYAFGAPTRGWAVVLRQKADYSGYQLASIKVSSLLSSAPGVTNIADETLSKLPHRGAGGYISTFNGYPGSNVSDYTTLANDSSNVSYLKTSRAFSFKGRLLTMAPSAQNKLVVRHVKIQES